MAAGIDINDRKTWAWTDETLELDYAAVDDEDGLHVRDPSAFYQIRDGVPYRHDCSDEDKEGNRQVFDPTLTVSVSAAKLTEAQIYDWAVSKGYINDQR